MQCGRGLYVSTFLLYFCNYYTISIVYLFFAMCTICTKQQNVTLHIARLSMSNDNDDDDDDESNLVQCAQ